MGPGPEDGAVRCSVNVPNFGDFADPRAVARLAVAAEGAGWDALFVWDHVVHVKARRVGVPFGDPWLLLAAAALATTTLRLGTLVTPVARRRPEQLARQVATLDVLSAGRMTLGVGLGGPVDDEYGSFGDTTDPVVLAERLDEGLDLLAAYWSGERVDHHGPHYDVTNVTLLPATVQRPRPPVWVGGWWPRRRPMRRAARWDGAVPLFESGYGQAPTVGEVGDVVAFLREERVGREGPFDVVVGGVSPGHPARAKDLVAPLVGAGATWWDERMPMASADLDRLDPVLRRVEQGPPTIDSH